MSDLPEFRADGVRVLITGGTSGLGAAMATTLLGAGARVAVTGQDASRSQAVAATLGRAARSPPLQTGESTTVSVHFVR